MPLTPATETGEVVQLLPAGQARVKIPKRSTCQGCEHRGFCDPFGTAHMVITADNGPKARIGQQVEVSFQSEGQGKAIVILYVIPLLALLIGAVIGQNLALFGSPDASSAVLSIGCVVLSFLGIRIFTRKQTQAEPGRRPRITRILS